jgi:hypothetical protein
VPDNRTLLISGGGNQGAQGKQDRAKAEYVKVNKRLRMILDSGQEIVGPGYTTQVVSEDEDACGRVDQRQHGKQQAEPGP